MGNFESSQSEIEEFGDFQEWGQVGFDTECRGEYEYKVELVAIE